MAADLYDLPELIENVRWIANHTTTGPINILLTAVADTLDHALDTIHQHRCPLCGAAPPAWWREDEARQLATLQASLNEHLLEPADALPLLAHIRHQNDPIHQVA